MTTTLTADDLSFWEAQFDSADPMAVTTAAEKLAKFKSEVPLDFRFTVCDKLWGRVGELGGDLIEGSGTDPRNNVPTATLKVKGSSPHITTMMGCRKEMVGVKLEIGGNKQAFYVDKHRWAFDKAWTGTAELKGIWDLLFWWVIWPEWFLPIQAQPVSHAIFVAPIVTAIEEMLSQCAIRLQSGLNEFFNNALSLNPDMRAWFGTLLQSNGNILELLKTPAYIVRHNPLLDGSPLIARTVRMETCGAVIRDLTKPYGVDVDVALWEPGDDQPDAFANLTQPTYVIRVTDRSQVVGPTKTIVDSVLRTAVDVQGSFFGDLFGPLLGRQNEIAPDGVFTAPNIGVDWVAPYAIIFAPEAGGKSPLATCEIVDHTPKGWQHIIGGRCVSGETLVHTADGLREARSLDGQEVLTLSRGGVYRPAKWKSYGEQQLFKVTFANGDEIFATHNHEWVVTDRSEKVTTLDLVGQRVPVVARAELYGQLGYLAPGDAAVEVVAVEATDRIETVYCCEEPVTNTWVAGSGYLTGNSPKWLNDVLNATFGWLIDSISILTGITGVPSNLLDGLLNDSFFAFALHQHYERRADMGPYHPNMEQFHATGSSPYNIEGIFTFLNILWDSRGWTSAQATLRDGAAGLRLGRDIFRGGLMTLIYPTPVGHFKALTDYVENTAWRIDEHTRDVTILLGDGQAEEAPLAKVQRFATGLAEVLNVATLAPPG